MPTSSDRRAPALRDRDGRNVSQGNACLLHRFLQHDGNRLHMLARSDLRHDAAEALVDVDLAGDLIRQHFAPAANDGHGRLVAACLDREYDVRFRRIGMRT